MKYVENVFQVINYIKSFWVMQVTAEYRTPLLTDSQGVQMFDINVAFLKDSVLASTRKYQLTGCYTYNWTKQGTKAYTFLLYWILSKGPFSYNSTIYTKFQYNPVRLLQLMQWK